MYSYEKDPTHKFKKEKEIDKYLHQVEKKRVIELKEQVKHMEKIVDIKLASKRERTENENENVKNLNYNYEHKQEKQDKELNQSKSQAEAESQSETQHKEKKEIDIKFATEKILKHIEKPGALNKCINLLKSLLISIDLRKLNPLVFIRIFYKISLLPFKFNEDETTRNITQLYEYVNKELIHLGHLGNHNYPGQSEDNDFLQFFSVFKIPFEDQISIITDDSFKFKHSIKKLDKDFTSIDDYKTREVEVMEKFENFFKNIFPEKNKNQDENLDLTIDIYQNTNIPIKQFFNAIEITEQHVLTLQNAIRRNFLFDEIKKAFSFYKTKWAYSSINTILTKLYLEYNSKFNSDQLDQLTAMINIIKNKSSSISLVDSRVSLRDEKIKNNPLEAYHQVTDARVEKVVDSGLDKWTMKQSGLSEGKMYINN